MSREREFLEYVLSSMLAMIGQSIYILADTYFVAKGLGANGLAALNLAIPIYNFINGVGLMIGIGGATRFIISRTVGDAERSRRIYTTAAISGVLAGLCFSLLGLFFVDPLTVLLGAKAETYEMTKIYLRMVLLFAPAFISNSIFSAFVKNDGGPKLAMLGMIAGSVFNTIFDYIFIFPMRLGIFGAVLATVFSPVMGILVLSLHLIRKKSSFYPVKRGYRFEELRRMLSLGVSSLISEITTGIVMIVFNIIILRLAGNAGVAAYGVLANIILVVIAVYNGIAQGSQPLFGRFFASHDIEKLHLTYRDALIAVGLASAVFYVATMGFPAQITALFNHENNAEMQWLAVEGFRLYFTSCVFLGFNLLTIMYFVSTARDKQAQILSLLRGIVLVLPFLLLFSALFGMTGVWIAMPAAEIVVTGIGIRMLRGKERKAA